MKINRAVHILAVEDNLADAKLIQRTLGCHPPTCQLNFVTTGTEALEYLFPENPPEHFYLPDLIFLDLNIPGVSGLDLLRKIRTNPSTKTIPVIVLTSSSSEQDVTRAYAEGACAYLCKPINLDDFINLMDNTFRFWLQTNTFNGRRCASST